MDIIFSHETALQLYAQLKVQGNEDVCKQRTSKDFRAPYSACSDGVYEEKLQFLKSAYGIALAQPTHEMLRNNPRYAGISPVQQHLAQRFAYRSWTEYLLCHACLGNLSFV